MNHASPENVLARKTVRFAVFAASSVVLLHALLSLFFSNAPEIRRHRERSNQFDGNGAGGRLSVLRGAVFVGARTASAVRLEVAGNRVWAVRSSRSDWSQYGLCIRAAPSPSLADVLYLLVFALFGTGIFLLSAERRTRGEQFRLALDMGIVVIASALLFWVFVFAPILATTHNTDPLTLAFALLYPVPALTLLFTIVCLLLGQLSALSSFALCLLALGESSKLPRTPFT